MTMTHILAQMRFGVRGETHRQYTISDVAYDPEMERTRCVISAHNADAESDTDVCAQVIAEMLGLRRVYRRDIDSVHQFEYAYAGKHDTLIDAEELSDIGKQSKDGYADVVVIAITSQSPE